MLRCTRKGCGVEYTEGSTDMCIHHPGAPVFHEGLKSWSCCSDINKPVLSFDDFMGIKGCSEIVGHTTEIPKAPETKPSATTTEFNVTESKETGKETYTSRPAQFVSEGNTNSQPIKPVPIVEEEDDLTISVTPGTVCKRKGCGIAFVSDEENRQGDGPGTVCVYHPSPPIFREGSKGYLCCKRRVLEFDEFLKIQGCKTGRHLFAPRSAAEPKEEEFIQCRVDHYQTPDKVYVSIFAKGVDKERSVINFTPEKVTLDVFLPGSKRFTRVLNLFGPIVPEESNYSFFNTKVELQLQKQNKLVWVLLEKSDRDISGINYTFGVGGRTGTIGGKEPYLDDGNKPR